MNQIYEGLNNLEKQIEQVTGILKAHDEKVVCLNVYAPTQIGGTHDIKKELIKGFKEQDVTPLISVIPVIECGILGFESFG
jgi:hypothetical protein